MSLGRPSPSASALVSPPRRQLHPWVRAGEGFRGVVGDVSAARHQERVRVAAADISSVTTGQSDVSLPLDVSLLFPRHPLLELSHASLAEALAGRTRRKKGSRRIAGALSWRDAVLAPSFSQTHTHTYTRKYMQMYVYLFVCWTALYYQPENSQLLKVLVFPTCLLFSSLISLIFKRK